MRSSSAPRTEGRSDASTPVASPSASFTIALRVSVRRGFCPSRVERAASLAAAFDGSPESEAALGLATSSPRRHREPCECSRCTNRLPRGPAVAPMGTADVGAVTQRDAMEALLHDAVAETAASDSGQGPPARRAGGRRAARGDRARHRPARDGDPRSWPLGRAVLGGVSAKVVRSASCPVIVVPKAPDPSQRTAARQPPKPADRADGLFGELTRGGCGMSPVRVGINGFGRIGRNLIRAAHESRIGSSSSAVNDIADPTTLDSSAQVRLDVRAVPG